MTAWAVWSALKKVPRDVWALVAGVLLVVAGYAAVVSYGARQYDKGKKAAAAGVVFDSVALARAAEAVAIRTAHTDTVTRTVLRTRYRVDTLIAALPDSAKLLPVVPELVATVQAFTVQVDSLTTAHAAERVATVERARVDSAAIYALRIIATAQKDTIQTLNKRPTRKKAALWTLVGILAGYGVGHAR
jgi:hypothetical protein